MYEDQTYEVILARMLARVPDSVDKREGSLIYDALAPAAAEAAQLYIELDINARLSFADTSSGEYLARRTAELGVVRNIATKAIRKGLFFGDGDTPIDIPLTSRFSINGINYVSKEKTTIGEFIMECEKTGIVGNQQFGTMLPIEYIPGLTRAELADILIPGEDAEEDENLRKRYFDGLDNQAYGGNIADYKEKTKALDGVGGVKVFPVWNGGGTVKLVVIDSAYAKPSSTLIDTVQTAADPMVNQGKGLGFAPIGHVVTVEGVAESTINIETSLTFQDGYIWADVQPNLITVLGGYYEDLRKNWEDSTNLVIRISQIETRILGIMGVLDIQNTKINGSAQNVLLSEIEIPIFGTVTKV
ncbi:putative phage Mu protein gp47-like protein [Desulfosporosinus orientis DSM 765]|uniref:Putative phage Mu protein gp47-like protein n=1 Tax=Desulfosporosinus orientis (strain ATCC 19365 / DSM 765 / NCIMB 8382 / VKM B-1628 / Singapore I) TaxID=768706 RepID=G7WEE5_DESOD|nr:baseplate J/gp47 family protein [Desulfosporosinus orientis]AET70758.1 putative phage Mu protein gp47-like protein [Desulfosporosinus orientis DSM 765]